jgi:KaiC/GvpD/RAD55 family RecA-like ATPase
MKTITTKIWGLDLLLGGGLKMVHRFDKESAVILVRGAPGTGKTLFAMQLATALSEGVNGDIAYACVELLPPELREQWASFSRGMPFFESPFPEVLPEPAKNANSVFVGLLDLGDNGDEPKTLEAALKSFIVDLRGMGKAPGVLIVDSLSDGYGLGSKLERHTVDSICKLAVTQGLCLLLIEETPDYAPSYWSFAVDTVFELSLEREGHNEYQRMLTIRKHRFGATDPGPHPIEFVPPKGIDVLPRVSAYATSMVREQLSQYGPAHFWDGTPQPWGIEEIDKAPNWPPIRGEVLAVYNDSHAALKKIVRALGSIKGKTGRNSRDIIVQFTEAKNVDALLFCNPYTTGAKLLSEVFSLLWPKTDQEKLLIRKVVLGNFRSLRSFRYGEEIFVAVGLLVGYLRRWGIPTILFETVSDPKEREETRTKEGTQRSTSTKKPEAPRIVEFVDFSIEILHTLVNGEQTLSIAAQHHILATRGTINKA